MKYLLDTDTVIYWMKGNTRISHKVSARGYSTIHISDITKAELYYGAYKSRKTNDNLAAIKTLSGLVAFLPLSNNAQSIFGQIKANLENQGKRLDDFDLLIASTALASELTLVTNNTTHFERIPGLLIENWV